MVDFGSRSATAIRRLLEVALGALGVAAVLAVVAFRAGRHAGQTHYGMEDSEHPTPFGDGQSPRW